MGRRLPVHRAQPQLTIATDEHLIFGRIEKVEVAVNRVTKCDVRKQPLHKLAGGITIELWPVCQHRLGVDRNMR
jgi:hypothetical protein